MATIVSTEISIGKENIGDVCDADGDIEAVVMDWRAECSWAE